MLTESSFTSFEPLILWTASQRFFVPIVSILSTEFDAAYHKV